MKTALSLAIAFLALVSNAEAKQNNAISGLGRGAFEIVFQNRNGQLQPAELRAEAITKNGGNIVIQTPFAVLGDGTKIYFSADRDVLNALCRIADSSRPFVVSADDFGSWDRVKNHDIKVYGHLFEESAADGKKKVLLTDAYVTNTTNARMKLVECGAQANVVNF